MYSVLYDRMYCMREVQHGLRSTKGAGVTTFFRPTLQNSISKLTWKHYTSSWQRLGRRDTTLIGRHHPLYGIVPYEYASTRWRFVLSVRMTMSPTRAQTRR